MKTKCQEKTCRNDAEFRVGPGLYWTGPEMLCAFHAEYDLFEGEVPVVKFGGQKHLSFRLDGGLSYRDGVRSSAYEVSCPEPGWVGYGIRVGPVWVALSWGPEDH